MATQAHALVCSCGEATDHIVARRATADGVTVLLWSNGQVTGRFGALPGVPVVRPKTAESTGVELRAGWSFMGWVGIYDTGELGDFYADCRAAARAGMDLAAWRKVRADRRVSLRPTWEVYETDRTGRPTLRLWKLPRLLFGGGLAVWDHCSGGRGGRYELVNVDRVQRGRVVDLVCGHGIRFPNLAALERHLVGARHG